MQLWSICAEVLISFALLAGLGLVVAKANIWSLGHVAFFGLGQIVAGGFSIIGIQDLSLVLVSAVFIGLLCALFLGGLACRLQDDWFIIVSLASVGLVQGGAIALLGPRGVSGINLPFPVMSDAGRLTVCIVPVVAVALALRFLWAISYIDRMAGAIRVSYIFSESLGINSKTLRVAAFSCGSLVACLAGVASAYYYGLTDPEMLTMPRSILLFVLLLLGGFDSVAGCLISSLLFACLPRILDYFLQKYGISYAAGPLSTLIFGFLMLLCLRFSPSGLLGRRSFRSFRPLG